MMPNAENVTSSTCWDACLLENVSEESFNTNLQQRFKRDQIYTYIGTCIVSINPYKPLSIYTPDLVKNYAIKGLFHLPPHIYGLTNFVHEWVQDFNEDQCIVTTGEVGAGKTETSRMVVHFLTNIAEIKRAKLASSSLLKLCRQRFGRSTSTTTTNSNPNSRNTTPKHCDKVDRSKGAIKKCSHDRVVEFDFGHRRSSENLKCVKHTLVNTTTTTPIQFSKSFEETIAGRRGSCLKHSYIPAKFCDQPEVLENQQQLHCNSNSIGGGGGEYQVPKLHCICVDFKSSPDLKHQLKSSLKQSPFKSRSRSNEAIPENESAGVKRDLWRNMRGASREKGMYQDDPTDLQHARDRVAQADVVLEALGNASTVKNANSSRFGKFFDVEFDFKGDVVGGHISHYMLEKSRITGFGFGERNFHIFYQVLHGADLHFLKSLKLLRNVDKYLLLHDTVATEDDKTNFSFTKRSLEILGLSQDEILSIFKIIAVVLKLGNLKFLPTTNIDGTEACEVSDEYELVEIASLLCIDEQILLNCLTKSGPNWSQLDNGSELDAYHATQLKYSLCRTLYARLFTYVVNRINDSLKFKHLNRGKNIGILDFYGFEILETNLFEQLAINYCSERLHQSFLQNVLQFQQNLYIREGLEWTKISYFDNDSICELMDKPNYGVLSLLDEPKAICDDTFLTRLHQCCSGHTNFVIQDSNLPPNCFQIRHFCGPVMYTVSDFIEKNQDILPKHVSAGLFQSRLAIVQNLFPEGNPKKSSKKPTSVSSNLRTSMHALVQALANRRNHYVFCVRPNDFKQPRAFEMPLVQHQVRCYNLLPLMHLWRTGHYFNLSHVKFFNRYKLLSNLTWPHFEAGTTVEAIAIIIRSVPLPLAEFTIGSKKVFIRSPRTVYELEDFRKTRLHFLAVLIQKHFRRYFHRKNFLQLRHAQIVIATTWRTWRECRFGIPFTDRRHMTGLYRAAREEYRIIKYRKQVEWAIGVISRHHFQWKRREFLQTVLIRLPANSMSPLCNEWPSAPMFLQETSMLLRQIYHRWRCYRYRTSFDQTSRNRMREKVTASIIFKDRKASYARSVSHPFHGDYVRLRQNVQWKKICMESNDQYVVFADIINKITRTSGKFVPVLLVLSTNSMLLLDQRTLQVKYRIPASEIYRMSLSPYLDDIAVFHVKAEDVNFDLMQSIESIEPAGCAFQSEFGRKKGDFVFQTGHVLEIVTKLFLVVQNATTRPPEVHISPEFEANFGQQTVIFTFKCNNTESSYSQPKVNRKGNRMEVII